MLLDEHVGRVFERVLRERGHEVVQAKDVFGEETNDADLVRWCGENDTLLVTNNATDFEQLHTTIDHAGCSSIATSRGQIRIRKGSPEPSMKCSRSTERSSFEANWSTSTSGTTGFTSERLPAVGCAHDPAVTFSSTRRSR